MPFAVFICSTFSQILVDFFNFSRISNSQKIYLDLSLKQAFIFFVVYVSSVRELIYPFGKKKYFVSDHKGPNFYFFREYGYTGKFSKINSFIYRTYFSVSAIQTWFNCYLKIVI